MKKRNIFILLGLFIILIILGILFYPQKESTQEKILEIIKPQIQSFCQSLDDNAIYSHCTICGGTYSGELEYMNYLYVNNFDEGQRERYKYIIEENNDFYNVTSRIHLIAGRNNRPAGSSTLSFEIDKEWNIIDSYIPEISECSYQ